MRHSHDTQSKSVISSRHTDMHRHIPYVKQVQNSNSNGQKVKRKCVVESVVCYTVAHVRYYHDSVFLALVWVSLLTVWPCNSNKDHLVLDYKCLIRKHFLFLLINKKKNIRSLTILLMITIYLNNCVEKSLEFNNYNYCSNSENV